MQTILLALDKKHILADQMARIETAAPDARLVITEQHEVIEPLLNEIEIAAGHLPLQWIPRAASLRWFQQWGAGTDWLMRHPEIAAQDFILTNASGVHAIPISEHILAFLLAFARRLPQAIEDQAAQHWDHAAGEQTFELAGKTMLLVGVGAIGRRTAQIAAAMGMRVLGVRHNPTQSVPGVERMFGTGELLSVLPQVDFVVLTLPLTAESRGMFGAQAFAQMKPSAYLVNIGRGGTVDEPALIHALESGQIAGAGLDVFATEPLPAESALWKLKNVIITPHYSGSTPHYDERALEIFIDNLERYNQGRPLRNVVDKQRGY